MMASIVAAGLALTPMILIWENFQAHLKVYTKADVQRQTLWVLGMLPVRRPLLIVGGLTP